MFSHMLLKARLAKRGNNAAEMRVDHNFKVDRPSCRTARRIPPLVAGMAAAVMALTAMPRALGQLGVVHRYSFTTDARDSVGAAHGTVIDAGTNPSFAFTGGQLDFSANGGNASNNILEDAYLDLPNGIVSAAGSAGMDGAVAFEAWFTISETRTWQRVYDFGVSNGGEGMSNLGSASDWVMSAANSGAWGNGPSVTNHGDSGGAPLEPQLGINGTTTNGVEHHVFGIYNHNNKSSFHPSGSNGTMTMFFDGALVGSNSIHPNINLRTGFFNDVNNWLGRSQWPDPLFDGSYNEFRIYNAAPSDAYVAASFAAGPNSVVPFQAWVPTADLSFTVNRATGAFTLSNGVGSIDVVGVNISSASGALNAANWLSISDNYDSDQGAEFDTDNNWIITVSTANQLLEVEQVGDGGQLGPGGTEATLQLGGPGAWLLSRYEDLIVSIDQLNPDNSISTLGVPVTYVGGLGAPAARSDLNFDGQVNAADWVEFASSHLEDLSGMTVAQAAVLGDLDGNLTNDYDDFLIFEADFDAANGVGALTAVIAGVPEPSAMVLMLAVGCAAVRMLRKGRRPHRMICFGAKSAFAAATIGVLLAGSPARAQLVTVISDDFESYTVDTPDTPVAPYAFGDPSNISAFVRSGVGVGGTQALEIQFDMTQEVTINTGLRYPRPTANNTTSNLAKYMLSFDMALVAGGVEGFFSSPKIELFSNNGVNASGFLIDDNLLTPGGGYQHYSYLLSEASEITFGHTEHVDPTVATLDVAFVFLGFPAGATQHQNYLIDNLKIEIAPPPAVPLTLIVNKTTEQVRIRNDSASPISFDYYSIESAMNALNPTGWNSLDDQNIDAGLPADFNGVGGVNGADLTAWKGAFGLNAGGDANGDGDSDGDDFLTWQRQLGQSPGPADGWIEAGGSRSSVIGELFLDGMTTLDPSEEVSLGAAYDNSVFGAANGDLVFNVSTGDSTALGIGQVTYVTSATAAGAAVPEPATVVLCLAAFGLLTWKRR